MIPDDEVEGEEFDTEAGYIHYGRTVKLVCTESNMALPLMIIRKVDKAYAQIDAGNIYYSYERDNPFSDSDDPVSQLHKCCFYIKGSNNNYLCLQGDKIIQYAAEIVPGDERKHQIQGQWWVIPDNVLIMFTDGCAWTIISTDQAKYTFYEAMGPTADLPTPVPIIEKLHVNGGGETACIDIVGKNFTSKLKVWVIRVWVI